MSLTKQIHLYSIDTSAFYDEQELALHKKMLKLYKLRQNLFNKKAKDKKTTAKSKYENQIWYQESRDWRKKSVNRVIKKYKEILSGFLSERENDITPRELNPEALREKNIISLFESTLTRALNIKTNELTEDLFVLNVYFFQVFHNLVRDGFFYKGEKYVFLTASAGQIRTKKAVFIKESSYKKIQKKLTCGLTIEDINKTGGISPNKLLAYLALNNSATDIWENFDIDKAIVVDDFETQVFGQVDYIDEKTYEIERKSMNVPIMHSDGMGIMLDGPTRMCRGAWLKGLLVQFPFDKFIKEHFPEGDCVVYDIYGKPHKIIGEGIRYIFTKSQFKLNGYYSSFEEYKQNFKKYGCEISYCNMEESYIPKSRINYQMLQTLSDMKDKEIDRLVKETNEEIESIGNDFQTTMKLLGATPDNKNPSWIQKSLMIYPELFRDSYAKDILKQTKASLVKQAKAGRLRVNGRYTFVVEDPYAFCEWLFLGIKNPNGLLEEDEVFCNLYKDNDELACLRSPHLYREWVIKRNKRNEELEKWFGMTKCVYMSCKTLTSKILQYDCDGDKLLVIKDDLLTRIAKRNIKNIVPLYYEMKKAKARMIDNEELYQGMIANYTGGNIGVISNQISCVWSNSEKITEKELKVVKWLCLENNFVISD